MSEILRSAQNDIIRTYMKLFSLLHSKVLRYSLIGLLFLAAGLLIYTFWDMPSIDSILDAYLTYVIDEYFLRFAVGYEHTDFGGGTTNGNAILLGAQMQR